VTDEKERREALKQKRITREVEEALRRAAIVRDQVAEVQAYYRALPRPRHE